MKILFVCRANVGRNQAAMVLYNLKNPGIASLAGTVVDLPGEKLIERKGTANIISIKEYGVDMSGYSHEQIDKNIIDIYDMVVVMAEPDTAPEWLQQSKKAVT